MTTSATNLPNRSIFTPALDLLLLGGLSVLLVGPIVLFDLHLPPIGTLASLLIAATVLNGAHFMASYRLLYSSAPNIKRYRWATIYVPALLLIYIFVSTAVVSRYPEARLMIDLFLIVVAYYLAIHYTGQTWGMMASFAYLRGIRFTDRERETFKLCLGILAFWQIVWATKLVALPAWTAAPLSAVSAGADWLLIATVPLAGIAFWRISRRIGRPVPLDVVLPFAALYVWYALLDRYPAALVAVQISHALQYLPFTLRVELNRSGRNSSWRPCVLRRTLLSYLGAMFFTGWLVFDGVPRALALFDPPYTMVTTMLLLGINIHHFFIDGVIWKLSNPIVRGDIFSHLTQEGAAYTTTVSEPALNSTTVR